MSVSFAPRKETDILREISLYLKWRKVFFWRINTTGVFDPRRRIFLKSPNTTPGVADLVCLKAGKLVALEVKSPTGKQRPEQKEFEDNIKRNGGEYHLVRSVQDVINVGL